MISPLAIVLTFGALALFVIMVLFAILVQLRRDERARAEGFDRALNGATARHSAHPRPRPAPPERVRIVPLQLPLRRDPKGDR